MTDDFTAAIIDFTERYEGRYNAECERCGAETDGSENYCEEWAYEHADTHRKWKIYKHKGLSHWHVESPTGAEWTTDTGCEAIESLCQIRRGVGP